MHSLSIGTGRVTEGDELSLHRNGSATAQEQFHFDDPDSEIRQRSNGHGGEEPAEAVAFDESKRADQSIIGYEEPIMLTQSTHSFLFTEPAFSGPFNFALFIVSISYTCLILALYNNVIQNFNKGNPFSVPVGVTIDVRISQYLALLIGLMMEEEIPESLYLLRMITERTLHKKEPNMKYSQFIFCAILRIIMVSVVHILCAYLLCYPCTL